MTKDMCVLEVMICDQRYVCARGNEFASFYDFFLLISTVVFFVFNFILPKCNTV